MTKTGPLGTVETTAVMMKKNWKNLPSPTPQRKAQGGGKYDPTDRFTLRNSRDASRNVRSLLKNSRESLIDSSSSRDTLTNSRELLNFSDSSQANYVGLTNIEEEEEEKKDTGLLFGKFLPQGYKAYGRPALGNRYNDAIDKMEPDELRQLVSSFIALTSS